MRVDSSSSPLAFALVVAETFPLLLAPVKLPKTESSKSVSPDSFLFFAVKARIVAFGRSARLGKTHYGRGKYTDGYIVTSHTPLALRQCIACKPV